MVEKHLDVNGKNIRVGDVVVIHGVGKLFPEDTTSRDHKHVEGKIKTCQKSIGFEGVVEGFGCVEVGCYNPELDHPIVISLADDEVEVIGNIRCKKSS